MISNISIKNFKLFKDINIEKISQFTLIGGKNNTGKSSLMEAIFMLFDLRHPFLTIRHNNSKGIMATPNTPEFFFEPIFNNFDSEEKIEINAKFNGNSRNIEIEKTVNNQIKLPIKNNNIFNPEIGSIVQKDFNISLQELSINFKQDNIVLEKSKLSLNPDLDFQTQNNTNVNSNININYNYARQPSNQSETAGKFSKLDINKQTPILLKVIQTIAPEIQSITVSAPNNINMIYVDIGKQKKIPLAYMGDGINRLVSIVCSIGNCENGIMLIDEIENGLHYSVIKDIWKGIIKAGKAFNCQIIATTHSDEFLQLAHEAMLEEEKSNQDNFNKNNFSYIKLEKDKDNKIYVGELDYETFDYAVSNNLEVR